MTYQFSKSDANGTDWMVSFQITKLEILFFFWNKELIYIEHYKLMYALFYLIFTIIPLTRGFVSPVLQMRKLSLEK